MYCIAYIYPGLGLSKPFVVVLFMFDGLRSKVNVHLLIEYFVFLLLTSVIRKTCIVATYDFDGWFKFMVFNATFNNILVISWWSVLLVEETGGNHRPVTSH